MQKVKIFLLAIGVILSFSVTAQGVRISNDTLPPHPSAMLDVKATDKGILLPRMTEAQRIAIDSPAVGLMIYQTNSTPGFYYFSGYAGWHGLKANPSHYVGELFGGGVVFWTDHLGEHGLICSMVDLSTSQSWSNVTNVEIGDSAQSHWNGPLNSLAILEQPQHVNSAAKLCHDYVNDAYGTGTFSDWYLPSVGEGIHLMNNLYEVQKALDSDGNPATTAITINNYWSSSECSIDSASVLSVCCNTPLGSLLKSANCYVRAVRAF